MSESDRQRRVWRREGVPGQPGFIPESMDKSIIAIPLLDLLDEEDELKEAATKAGTNPYPPHRVIIDLNLQYKEGRGGARRRVESLLQQIASEAVNNPGLSATVLSREGPTPEQYLFAEMNGPAIRRLAGLDDPESGGTTDPAVAAAGRAIYRIWPDFEAGPLLTKSVSTVKADAARSSFAAMGHDIVWAVIDSGIDEKHPHFALHKNLELPDPLRHFDYTGGNSPLTDEMGHGTHVAGIVAGEIALERDATGNPITRAYGITRSWNQDSQISYGKIALPAISGIAPKCKLVSMKVLKPQGGAVDPKGYTSDIIAALEQIQAINGNGRRLLIHGVNLSIGYDFQPEWFACGQSPLCIEVDRLVRSGVVVVVAAGNTGYGFVTTQGRGVVAAGMNLSINDPGNADLAITVGSTHREMPHTYGVSYFSSKGPTGDGRLKPDVIAPGEKVLSCAAGDARTRVEQQLNEKILPLYVEQSGTSMAAPHVSGVIAAFLSIRREFIGRTGDVKNIFVSTATDLHRDRYFQGSGLVDLMRAIQSI